MGTSQNKKILKFLTLTNAEIWSIIATRVDGNVEIEEEEEEEELELKSKIEEWVEEQISSMDEERFDIEKNTQNTFNIHINPSGTYKARKTLMERKQRLIRKIKLVASTEILYSLINDSTLLDPPGR